MSMMGPAAANPDAYIAALSGWQLERCTMLRAAVMRAAPFDETIKWTNLVFMANGPCILIRAEEHRVLLGFWRGKRLRALEPRIQARGKYELGNLVMTEFGRGQWREEVCQYVEVSVGAVTLEQTTENNE